MSPVHRTKVFLTDWVPWMIVAYVGLVAVIVYGYTLNARTLRDEAVRTAEASSAHQSAVARCLASRPLLLRTSAHVLGVNEFAATLVQNSAASLKKTPRSDPIYKTRKANLRRLIVAREKIKQIQSFPVPTKAQCRKGG